jgi:hypothetical protein
VGLEKALFEQGLGVAFDLYRGPEAEERHWSAALEVSAASFHKPDVARPTVQPDVKAYELSLSLLRSRTARAGEWELAWGALIDRSYRWVKTAAQSVDAEGALSLGPAASLTRSGPLTLGARAGVPLIGVLTSGQIGIRLGLWAEAQVATLYQTNSIGLSALFDSSYLRWDIPSGTHMISYSVTLAPVLHLGSSNP